MKKDVIYIDLEDDITSIIEKVKSSGEKIIALVPPKRVGVLQSAVNLKLLHKAAGTSDKHIVLITTDKALSALASGVQIPVAKTLQSRPELAAVSSLPTDEEEDVINGDQLPVGELAKTAPPPKATDGDEEIVLPEHFGEAALGSSAVASSDLKPKKSTPTIPNFGRFRKKFLFGGIALLLLLLFFVWAIAFAPKAEVNISAKTTEVPLNFPTSLNPAGKTDPTQNIIKPAIQQVKKTNSLDFDATGKKDVGEKATGTVTIINCASRKPSAIAIPAGTAVSSDGLNFLTASAISVPGGDSSSPFGGCDKPGQASVAVSAQEVGEQYNLKKGSNFSVADQSSGVSASNPNAFAGGSKRQITVISEADVAAAKQKLAAQDQEAIKQQLVANFDAKKQIVISESFTVAPGEPALAPALGAEASKGRITQEITYTVQALAKTDTSKILKTYVQKNTIKDKKDQQVYEDGLAKLKLSKFVANETGSSVQLTTIAQTGPTIDVAALKPRLIDKNYEEIRQIVQKIDGVEEVDTNFSPFWVNKISDPKKITIKFTVSEK